MKIAGYEIGSGHRPFIVCEIGAAHNGLLDRALTLMEQAKRCGADGIKIQAFTPDTITFPGTRPEFTIQSGPWMGRTLYDLYSETHMPREWYPALFDRARDLQIPLFASVFSREDLIWMERMNCPAYKIASCEVVDVDLIEAVGYTRKPIIISTGMAISEEIDEAIGAYCTGFTSGALPMPGMPLRNIAILHCVSAYPTDVRGAGLGALDNMRERWGAVEIAYGLSDHTLGIAAPIVATVKGAAIIEKHLTLSRKDGGPDDFFASEPDEFIAMVRAVQDAHSALRIETDVAEMAHVPLRRSLYVVKDVKAGERFTRNNLRSIRPGNGLPVKQLPALLNMRARVNVLAGTPMSEDFVERV